MTAPTAGTSGCCRSHFTMRRNSCMSSVRTLTSDRRNDQELMHGSSRTRPKPNEAITRHRSLDDPATAREFLHKVGEGVYISDLQGRVLDANPAFLEIFGVASLRDLAVSRGQ